MENVAVKFLRTTNTDRDSFHLERSETPKVTLPCPLTSQVLASSSAVGLGWS
jgi:hypothetical protein